MGMSPSLFLQGGCFSLKKISGKAAEGGSIDGGSFHKGVTP
jgi:hypothetical protein